jgi:predicted nucleic acid-binding protein
MYAAGAAHRNRAKCVGFLERVAIDEVEAALDAEVLQELLHRYRLIKRWADGRRIYDLARRVFTTVYPIDSNIVDRARLLMDTHRLLCARDALHAAVVLENGLEGICSFDRDFDRLPILNRVEPE